MRYGYVLFFIWISLFTTAKAQDTLSHQTGRRITLQEAINIALKNNYQLKQASNNLELADKQILGAKANFLPSISGQLSAQRTVGQQFVQSTVSFSNVTTNRVSGGVSGSLPIFQGFQNILTLRRSNINKDYQKASKQRARETVIFQTVNGFLQVVLNQQLLKISRQTLASSQQQLKQIKGQVQVGLKATSDQYDQESTVASNKLDILQQENQLSFSKTQLLGTLQLDPTKNYTFAGPDLKDLNPVPRSLNLVDLINQALANRHDLKAQKFLIQRNKQEIGLSRAVIYPSLSLNGGINTLYNDNLRIGPQRRTIVAFHDQFFDQNVNKFIGFRLNVPIFNKLNYRLNVQQSKINYKNSKLQYQNLKYSALQEVRQAYNDYLSYQEQLSSTATAVKAAKKSFQVQQERYKVGAGSHVEFDNAQTDYENARANRAQAVFRFIFQQKLLDFYLGKISKNISFRTLTGK